MNTTMKVLGGFLGGVALGAIAGVLMAPDRGSNTRQKIKDESKRLSGEIGEAVAKSMQTLAHPFRTELQKLEHQNGGLERSKVTA